MGWSANEFDALEYGKLMESYSAETDERKGTITPYLPDDAKENPTATDLIAQMTHPSLLEIFKPPYFGLSTP